MNDTHFKSAQNLFFLKDTVEILSSPPSILLDFMFILYCVLQYVHLVQLKESRDRIWYRENGVPKNWIWPQKREILLRGHPLIPLVAPKKVYRCPKKPPEDLAKFWLKMPLLTFWSIVGTFLHRYAIVIPFWKADT